MPEWLGILLPFAVFAVFFVLLRHQAEKQPRVTRKRRALVHVGISIFMLSAILAGVAANLPPLVVFAAIFVGVLLILRLASSAPGS
jgi:F0F1-type ATP synthase assembly protein I